MPLPPAQLFRQLHLVTQARTDVARTWRQLRRPGLHKALALALRRLSYQAHRQRVEDELVDILIAAEALYLSDVGYATELSFRLAHRAAALCSPQKLSMTRRNVFDLMRSAYGVRSVIGLYATKRGPSRRAVRSVCHMIPPQVLRLGAGVVPARPVARARG
jgi:hypothetical protein